MAMTAMLIGGALGLGKSALIDSPQAAREAAAKAEIMRWSPWTHLNPDTQKVHYADPFASAVSGAAMGQNYNNAKGILSNGAGAGFANPSAADGLGQTAGVNNSLTGYPGNTWSFNTTLPNGN